MDYFKEIVWNCFIIQTRDFESKSLWLFILVLKSRDLDRCILNEDLKAYSDAVIRNFVSYRRNQIVVKTFFHSNLTCHNGTWCVKSYT